MAAAFSERPPGGSAPGVRRRARPPPAFLQLRGTKEPLAMQSGRRDDMRRGYHTRDVASEVRSASRDDAPTRGLAPDLCVQLHTASAARAVIAASTSDERKNSAKRTSILFTVACHTLCTTRSAT